MSDPVMLGEARAHAERLPALSAAGDWLVFVEQGAKWYARTPGGEYAFSDAQGLYEWRRAPGGQHAPSSRIDHTGGDRSGARNGQALRSGSNGGPQARGRAEARRPHPN